MIVEFELVKREPDKVIKRLVHDTYCEGYNRFPNEVEKLLREGFVIAKVFCVGCGAQKRTLRKWHNSYLCTDCYKIMMRIGEEKYIKALRGD